MAAGDFEYGTRTVLANASRLHSMGTGTAYTFGEIDNSSALALGYQIHLKIPLTTNNDKTMDIYLLESQDGSEWTDDIDPTADSGDVAAKISDAKHISNVDATYHATNRAAVELHFTIWHPTKYIGFVVLNNCDEANAASGADGDSQSISIAAS